MLSPSEISTEASALRIQSASTELVIVFRRCNVSDITDHTSFGRVSASAARIRTYMADNGAMDDNKRESDNECILGSNCESG